MIQALPTIPLHALAPAAPAIPQSWRQEDRAAQLETLRRTHGAGLRR